MPYRTLKDLIGEELFGPGHALCPGCGAGIISRLVTRIGGRNTIIVQPTGCLEVSTTLYPLTSWRVPWIHMAFENAAAVASGVRAAYNALLRKGVITEDVNVVVLAGDGGTADIGFQAMSGAFERGDRFLFICYDNEAYMNTGMQRSGATPYGAATTTTPPGKFSIGQRTLKKDLMGSAIASNVKYAATGSPSHIIDLANKLEKALKAKGPSFIHFLSPCIPGWRIDSHMTIKISRLAVQTGLWPLYEYEDGRITVTVKVPKRIPVIDYIKLQGRFGHLLDKPEEISKLQAYADALAEKFGLGPVEYPKAPSTS